MILIDTGPLVALCDRRDANHRRAVKDLERLVRQPLATFESVITEACFHLSSSPARMRLHKLLVALDVEIAALADGSERNAVFAWLERYAEHEPDWADGCVAVRCGRRRSDTVWTYDREFTTTWRRPNGTRIPLAID